MIFFDDEIFINIDSAFPYLKTSESDSNSFGDIRCMQDFSKSLE
jgi:hypothetical protein